MTRNQPTIDGNRREEEIADEQAYLTVARRLRHAGRPIIGLWPVPLSATFDDLPRRLAVALASWGVTVGLVAPRECWHRNTSPEQLLVANLDESVDFLTPGCAGVRTPSIAVEQALALVRHRYASILVDFSGLEEPEAREMSLLPGLAVLFLVAQGRVSEFALTRLRRQIPAERLAGALLVTSTRRAFWS